MKDLELVNRLKHKDQSAYVELVNLYSERVLNICFGFLRSEEEARDTAQEVFIEIFLSIRHFRSDSALSTWIYRIAVNKSLDLLRKHQRKKRFAYLVRLSHGNPGETGMVPASGDTPLSQMIAREQQAFLERAVGHLPGSQRIAWTLHKLEGMPQTEVATVMGNTVPAVESLIHRAKKNIARYMEKRYYSGSDRKVGR